MTVEDFKKEMELFSFFGRKNAVYGGDRFQPLPSLAPGAPFPGVGIGNSPRFAVPVGRPGAALSGRAAPVFLFIPKRAQRIFTGGPPRGNQTGEQRHQREEAGNRAESKRIAGADTEKQAGHGP